jgi:hypothetical protein
MQLVAVRISQELLRNLLLVVIDAVLMNFACLGLVCRRTLEMQSVSLLFWLPGSFHPCC